jgi:2-polyprenyl-6-methoxyphenol hydroxylase-like FAD-dependent oxidoreductase
MSLHVIIVGGGIAGPALALFLAKAGISSAVYEAYGPSEGPGGGLGLAPNGLNVLAELGLAEKLSARGSPARNNRFYDERGRLIAQYSTGGSKYGEETLSCMRGDLNAVLIAALSAQNIPITYYKRLHSIDTGNRTVIARFTDGSMAEGDIVVGCDGIHSQTRRLTVPDGPEPQFVGIVGIGGAVRREVVPIVSEVDAENFNFVFGPNGFFGYCGGSAGEEMWWSNLPRAQPYSEDELKSFSSDALKWQMLKRYENYSQPIPTLIKRTAKIMAINIFDVQSLPRWYDDRAILIGDAAHAVSPNAGQGASLALEDAMYLAKMLRDYRGDYNSAFAQFERKRRPRVERVVAEGRRRGRDKAILTPFQSKLRNLAMRIVLPLFGPKSQDWMYSYRIKWRD